MLIRNSFSSFKLLARHRKRLDCKAWVHSLDGTSNYVHFTDPSSEVGILLHCLHNFLVLVGQFSEGCSCDVLLGLYMAVHAHDYSGRGEEIDVETFHIVNFKITG